MRLGSRHYAWALAALLTAGCGDPLVDTSYRGVPLLTLRGQVFGTSNEVDVNNPTVRLALFWVAEGLDGGPLDNASEQVDTGVAAQVPEAFLMNVFTMPRIDQLITESNGTYGVAHILAYVDTNGNGRKDSDEPIVGIDDSHLIIAALTDLTADESPTGTIVTKGLHVVSIPLTCAAQRMGVVGGTTCDVPLGQPCMRDADCGDNGVCLQTFIEPWPSGGCALPYTPTESCTPTGAVVVHGPEQMSYWIEACETDADCARGFPYVCDLSANACLPTGNLAVQVSDDVMVGSLCEPAAPDGGIPMMVDGGRYPYPDGGCPLGPGVTQAGPDDAGMCPAPPPAMDGGLPPFPDGGCQPGPDGQPVGPNDAGYCPGPLDGGMLPPPDGGMLPPPDGGMLPPRDGGMLPPPDGGMLPPPDGGMLPPDGGMPPLDAGGASEDAGSARQDAGTCPSPPELDGGLCPGPDMTLVPAPDSGVCPPPPRDDAGMCPGPRDAG